MQLEVSNTLSLETENACTIWWCGLLESMTQSIITLFSIYIVVLLFTAMTSYFLIFCYGFLVCIEIQTKILNTFINLTETIGDQE